MATLDTSQVKQISNSKREDGRQQLADVLSLDIKDEDELGSSIKVDYLYECLMFAVERGFPYTQIGHVFKLGDEFQTETIGMPMVDAIELYNKKVGDLQGHVSERNLTAFTEYIFTTYMRHYKLYQYVFTRERDTDLSGVILDVEPPLEPSPFVDGKEKNIWEYEQKMAVIKNREDASRMDIQKKKDAVRQENESELRKSYEAIQKLETTPNKEMLSKLIQEVATSHVSTVGRDVRTSIEETVQDLEYKLEKTGLARPQVLGPPPRYSIRSPNGRAKSPGNKKSASRSAKSRGSKK